MKRFVGLCLAALLLLSVFGGCEMPNEISNNETTTNQEMVVEKNTTESNSVNRELSEEELHIVSCLLELSNTDLEKFNESDLAFLFYWDDYTWQNNAPDDPDNYTFSVLDMNGDGLSEIIVERFGEHCIIYYNNTTNSLKALHFGFGEMYYINEDGTFSWNDMSNVGHEYGLARLDDEIWPTTSKIYLWTIRNDGTDYAEFFVNDIAVTKSELQEYDSQFEHKRIEFYDLTSENLSKYITFETIVTEIKN